MTDTNTPKDSKNSAKESSSTDDSTQEKLTKLAAGINKDDSTNKAASVASKTVETKPLDKPKTPPRMSRTSNTAKNNMNATNKTKISKTAVLALLISLIAVASVGGFYYLQKIQNNQQSEAFAQQLTSLNNANEQRINQLISKQNSAIDNHVNSAITQVTNTSDIRIKQLEAQISALKQNQPSDWLIHEAEYLIRIASRTIWLEHDTAAAINLLQDADARINELNSPEFLPIRQLISEDTEALKLMPTLKTEEVILTLLGLSKQLPLLSFSMAKIPNSNVEEQNLELSADTADWRSNLDKTWQKFLADFITIRRREGNVEPLMSTSNQQHLKENLALKLQQAQWAASEEKSQLFTQTLEDISQWLSEYFDMGHLETAKFYQSIQLLKNETVSYNYPTKLQSLNAIRQVLSDKSVAIQAKPTSNKSESIDSENNINTEVVSPNATTETAPKKSKEKPAEQEQKAPQQNQQKTTLEDA